VQGIDQHIQETPHFRIHYTPESFAEQHLTQIGERLGHAYGILSHLLGVDTSSANVNIIDVYLTELLTDSQLGEAPESSGYIITSTSEIHEVYRADAPGNSLERSLLQVMLGIALDIEYVLPPLVFDGLLAYITEGLEDTSPGDEVMTELAEGTRQHNCHHQHPAPGPTHTTQEIQYPAAASFVKSPLRTYDENRFQEFLRRLQAGTAADASSAYGYYGLIS
jgi:hypothetical protein